MGRQPLRRHPVASRRKTLSRHRTIKKLRKPLRRLASESPADCSGLITSYDCFDTIDDEVSDEDLAEFMGDLLQDNTDNSSDAINIPTITYSSLITLNAAHLREVMEQSGFVEHGQGTLGHHRKLETLKTSLYRLSTMLVWTFQFHHDNCQAHNLSMSGMDLRSCLMPNMWEAWFVDLVNFHAILLQPFCDSLEHDVGLLPNTILTYLSDLMYFLEWFAFFRHGPLQVPLSTEPLRHTIAALRVAFKKSNRRLGAMKNSKEASIYHRKMPVGGIVELQEAVRIAVPAILARISDEDIEPRVFRAFMDLLFAALYSFAAQGRNSGIATLSYSQGVELLRYGQTLNNNFKTEEFYTYQPVTLHQEVKPILAAYINVIRPLASGSSVVPPSPQDPLWLFYNGNPCNEGTDIGSCVSRFFLTYLGYPLTITNIRSIVESTTTTLYNEGVVTDAHKNAIHNINGHCERTAKEFYLRDSRADDVARGREVFREIMEVDEQIKITQEEVFEHPPEPTPAPWGTQHPNYGNPCNKKAKWSQDELSYIESWQKKQVEDQHNGYHPVQDFLFAHCLKHIRKDPSALPIFHLRHVANTTRLRGGFTAVNRKRKREKLIESNHSTQLSLFPPSKLPS